ncbi:hypothetical protein OHC74_00570, partial [Escherichia coli]
MNHQSRWRYHLEVNLKRPFGFQFRRGVGVPCQRPVIPPLKVWRALHVLAVLNRGSFHRWYRVL